MEREKAGVRAEREQQCDLQSEAEASGSLLEFHHLHEFEAASLLVLLVHALRCFRGESCFYYLPCGGAQVDTPVGPPTLTCVCECVCVL